MRMQLLPPHPRVLQYLGLRASTTTLYLALDHVDMNLHDYLWSKGGVRGVTGAVHRALHPSHP